MLKKTTNKIFLLFVFALFLPRASFGEVVLHDNIGLVKEEVTITAETKGRYFSKGGALVSFSAEGKSIGSVLSGGDGFAYKSYVPQKPGLTRIIAKYGRDKDNGIVMALKKGSSIVFVDVEGSLLAGPFSKRSIEGSNQAIKNITNKYPVVYLHAGNLGLKSIKEWLRKNRFPESVVMSWDMGSLFAELGKKGFRIKAIIGSQAVIESAAEYKPLAYSFDEFGGALHVNDWKEIENGLK